MIEYGIFHNGTPDLPAKRTKSGYVINEGTLADQHLSAQRVIAQQVQQAVLADKLGFDYWFQTEHHFEIDGPERNSSTMAIECAIAVLTKRIRIGQLANILPWWQPLRLASFVGTLDVLSGGRAEFGIGRGYQSREAETLGSLLGSTMMDEEKNRGFYEEAYDVIMKAWTEPSFSYHGDYMSFPPSDTKWNNPGAAAFFEDESTGYALENVINKGVDGPPEMGLPVYNTTTSVREISVMPQTVQRPHPQVWTPVTSDRSIGWAAKRGINAYFASETAENVKKRIETYHRESEAAGWSDYLDRGEFKYGWDCERKRGSVPGRFIHVTEKGVGRPQKEVAEAADAFFSFFAGFGLVEGPVGDYYDVATKSGLWYVGSNEQIIESILELKEYCGYDDFMLGTWFEMCTLSGEETETQMRNFAENIMPVLERELGGKPKKPEVASVVQTH